MREFEESIDYISKGLRPRARSSRTINGLTECFNLRCGTGGLEPYTPMTDPLGIGLLYSWPFPQFLTSARYKFLIVRDTVAGTDRIYEVSSDYSTVTLILSADYPTFGEGERWSLADFDEYVLLTNGVVMVYRDTTADTFVPALTLDNTPRGTTMCNFRGQLVMGSIESDWYSTGNSHLVWSKIGDVDCTPDENNEAGFMKVPFEGFVYVVKELGDFVVAYCEGGILALRPVTSPAPTFAVKELSSVGIHSDYAVDGDKNNHVFVDSSGYLWRIDKNLNMVRLDYQEFMLPMAATYIVVNHDPSTNDFYIGNGVKSYLLSDQGLTEISESVLSLAEPYLGLWVDLDDSEARITTDLIDMGYRGFKGTEVIEAGFAGGGTVEVALDWRMKSDDALSRTNWVEVNDQGIATNKVSGTEFRVAIRGSDYTSFEIDYLKLRYKMSDIRSIRGIYAPPPRGQ